MKNMDKDVFIVEKNVRGAWVIFGARAFDSTMDIQRQRRSKSTVNR